MNWRHRRGPRIRSALIDAHDFAGSTHPGDSEGQVQPLLGPPGGLERRQKKNRIFSKKSTGTAAHALFQKKKSAHFSFCHNMIQGHPAVKGYAPLAARASVMAHLLDQELDCCDRKFGIAKVDARRLNSVYYYCVKCTTTQTEDCFTPTSREHQRCRHCHNGKQMERPSICTGKRKQGADNQKRDQRPYKQLYCEAMARVDFAKKELAAHDELPGHMPDIDMYQWCFECEQALGNDKFTPTSLAKYHCQSCEQRINAAKRQPKDHVAVLMDKGYKIAHRYWTRHPEQRPCFAEWRNRELFKRHVYSPWVQQHGGDEKAVELKRKDAKGPPSLENSCLVVRPEHAGSLSIVSLRESSLKRARVTKADVNGWNKDLTVSVEQAQDAGSKDLERMMMD